MVNLILSLLIGLYLFVCPQGYVLADSQNSFDQYMNEWEVKRNLASKYLLEAEAALKSGDELNGCAFQKKASEFGIEGTQALIKAMKVNGSKEEIQNLETGLRKWQELRDFC